MGKVADKGLLITFEGTEGSGKSTQIRRTVSFLRRQGFSVSALREPGGTRVSEAIRDILLDPRYKKMVPETELLLYLAARAQIAQERILPALREGKAVVCDRFEDSTLAYQGFGRGFALKDIRKVSRLFVHGGLKPDLTVLLDISPRKGFARGGRRDRMEKQSMRFHKKVREGFLTLAGKESKRFLVLDASQGKDQVFERIRERLYDII